MCVRSMLTSRAGRLNSKRPLMAAWRVRCASAGLEESLWLCPIEDRRRLDSCREGMLEGFSLGSHFLLVDYTGRLYRKGKAAMAGRTWPEFSTGWGVMPRAGGPGWKKLRSGRLFGRFFAASRERLREVAERLDVRNVWQTWLAVRRDDAKLNFGRHRQRNHSLPPFISHPQAIGTVRQHIFSLNWTRAAWCDSGSPSRPVEIALAGTSRGSGLLRCLGVAVNNEL